LLADKTALTLLVMDDLRCPQCGAALRRLEGSGVALFGCTSCHGHWLDNNGSKLVVEGKLPEPARAQARKSAAARPPAEGYRQASPVAPDGPRRCPFCKQPLGGARVPQVNIVVDACSQHGTWFDPKELHQVAQHYEIKLADAEGEAKALSAMIDRATALELLVGRDPW